MHQDSANVQGGLNDFVYIGTAVFLILALLFIAFIVFSVQKRKRLKAEQEQMKEQFENTLLRSQLEIREQTLKTISQEIHDNIGQVLSLAKINLNTMEPDQREDLIQKIQNSRELVSKAIRDLRDLSRTMNTDHILSLGLIRALESELELLRKTGYDVSLTTGGEPYKLGENRELILFRIIQECLNNSIKHAATRKIFVKVNFGTAHFQIEVRDDGRGFDSGNADDTGQGLRNMQSRAAMIGAGFTIQSAPGQGTTVHISLPC